MYNATDVLQKPKIRLVVKSATEIKLDPLPKKALKQPKKCALKPRMG
jgi:hypothetical protein